MWLWYVTWGVCEVCVHVCVWLCCVMCVCTACVCVCMGCDIRPWMGLALEALRGPFQLQPVTPEDCEWPAAPRSLQLSGQVSASGRGWAAPGLHGSTRLGHKGRADSVTDT